MSNAAKIKELEAEVARLKKADAIFAALQPEHQLAISLHKLLCHHNHTDGCGWEYEATSKGTDWGGYAHKEYLQKALVVMAFCNRVGIKTDDAIELMKLMRGY